MQNNYHVHVVVVEGTSYNPYAYDGHRSIFPQKYLKISPFPPVKPYKNQNSPLSSIAIYCSVMRMCL